MNIKEIILIVIGFITLTIAFFYLGGTALNKSEIAECYEWQEQAIEYRAAGFYLTGWQAAQCAAHNIEVDAPVLTP